METAVTKNPIVFIRKDEKQIGYFDSALYDDIEFVTRRKGGVNVVGFTFSQRDFDNISNALAIVNEPFHHYLHTSSVLVVIESDVNYSLSLEFKREENKVVMLVLTDNGNTIVKWYLLEADIERYLNSY